MENGYKIKLMYGATPEDAALYLPVDYKPWLITVKEAVEEVHIFVSMDKEEEAAGLGIFMTYKANPALALLLYVNIKEKHRGKGHGSAMIRQGIRYLQKEGYKRVEAIVPRKMGKDAYMVNKGFSKTIKEIYMSYHLHALRKCRMGESFDKLRPLINRVKRISEIPEEALDSFHKLAKKMHHKTDITKFDPELSGFYVVNGEVLGYMAFCMYDSRIVTMFDCYISRSKEAKYAFPAILSEIIERAFSEDSEDFKVSLYINNTSQYEFMKELLGDPFEEAESSRYELKI